MIALFILGLAAAGIGWHITRLTGHHRFQSEAADICLAFQEAQFVSVIHETECELLIYLEKGRLFYQLKTDEPIAVIDQTAKPLKEARFITLNNAKSPHASFKVLSSGRIEPTAILGLHQRDPADAQLQGIWLDLQTPVQIKIMHEKPQKATASLPQKPSVKIESPQIDPNQTR
ncbi:MAG: hypothetical protein JSR39_07875 [Verrucomicrobia bacterium]|nr:hypothetical protein [Verrucomicrobiota bacterium]